MTRRRHSLYPGQEHLFGVMEYWGALEVQSNHFNSAVVAIGYYGEVGHSIKITP
jgi:hypothetical protein